MRDQCTGIDLLFLNEGDDVGHVLGNAAGSADHVDAIIVDPVQIKAAGKIVDSGAGKEINAAILPADGFGHGKESRNRHHDEHIVETAFGDLQQ